MIGRYGVLNIMLSDPRTESDKLFVSFSDQPLKRKENMIREEGRLQTREGEKKKTGTKALKSVKACLVKLLKPMDWKQRCCLGWQ